ncbi:MAG TPA: transcriptional repressor [Chitinophagaceae bacterium]|jgi:Fur family ferric uptake transcriptional regulator
MTAEVNDILKRNNLSVTESRKKILNLFLNVNGALAHGDIEKKAGEKFDRVTVYRTLQTFVEKGIIHIIPTTDNSVRYALCKNNCTEGHHRDNHVHFTCLQCGITYCLEEVHVPEIRLPKGFLANEIEVVAKGTCSNCSQ